MADSAEWRAERQCRIRTLGVELTVGCPAALVLPLLRQMRPFECEVSDQLSTPTVRLVRRAFANGEHRFELCERDRVAAVASTQDDLMLALQHWVDGTLVGRVQHLVPVHAGVVAWEHRAILLPGSSGAGKTTLVAALVEGGATYYSDEYAWLDASGCVHPYPRHMIVRGSDGSSRSQPVRTAHRERQPVPVGLVLEIRYAAEATFSVEPLCASEAVLAVLAHTAHRLSPVEGVPTAIRRAAGDARAFRGVRGPDAEAARAILALARREPA